MIDFFAIRKTIADLGEQVRKLHDEREHLQRQREDMESLPLAKADLLTLLDDWVDRQAASFPERLATGCAFYLRNPLAELPKSKEQGKPLAVLGATSNPADIPGVGTLESSLFFVLGGAIKQGLRPAVEAMDLGEEGPPRAERLAMLEAIDARINALDDQERELREQAAQSGLVLPA